MTLLGFLFTLTCSVVMYIYNPEEPEGDFPDWVLIYVPVAMFLYQVNFSLFPLDHQNQVLDAADGIQARKNGTTSPLGMLFDHGCDVVSLFLILLFGLAVFRLQFDYNGLQSILLLLTFFIPAFFHMSETYFLRALHLPILNGPNEGILFPAVGCIVSYFTGT